MKSETSLKLRFSKSFILLFGIASFGIGFLPNNFPEEHKLSDMQKLIWVIVCSPTIALAAITGLQNQVVKDVEEEVEPLIEREYHETVMLYRQKNKELIEGLKVLENKLNVSGINNDVFKDILDGFKELEASEKKYDLKQIEAARIAKWLDTQEIQVSLLEEVVVAATSGYGINEETLSKFKEDIAECINWIYCSLDYFRLCKVDPIKYTSALNDMPRKDWHYKTALNRIYDYIRREGPVRNLSFLKDCTCCLIEEAFPSKRLAFENV